MATPRKRKNTADNTSMKINKYFKPVKHTVVHLPPENNNDENLPPQGQPAEKKRALGQKSLIKSKPVKTPLRDRNPEVRISASLNTENNRVPFTVLKDDDIKNGVVKAPQFERKEPNVSQASQASSQPDSAHSSQSSISRKDDFITKIKPKKLFEVYNDHPEDVEDEQSHAKHEEESLTNHNPFSVFTDNLESDSQTSYSQQENADLKQKPFSVFIDNDQDKSSQSSQSNHSQQDDIAPQRKPFSVLVDRSNDEQNQYDLANYLQKESVPKKKPFSVFTDDNNPEDEDLTDSQKETVAPRKKKFSIFTDKTSEDEESDLADSQRETTAPKKRLFSIFKEDNSDESSQKNDSQEGTNPTKDAKKRLPVYIDSEELDEFSQKENVPLKETVHNTKPKKLFTVYNDENQLALEDPKDDVGFTIFRDEEPTTTKQTETRVLRDKTKDAAFENTHSRQDNFWDDEEEEDEDDLNIFLTHTNRDESQEHDFFSDDGDSDSYSEIQLLHNDTYSTICDPFSVESEDSTETQAHNLESNPSDSKDTNYTSPSDSIILPDPLLEARTLELLHPDPIEELHVAYPNPRGESLDDKLGLTKEDQN